MSLYAVQEVCIRTLRDPEFREAIKQDPVAALAPLPLSSKEREAFLSGDVATLYEMGTHPYLLAHLCRWSLFGLTVPVYSERIRAAKEPRKPGEDI
jgi:hypothetical protein